MLKTKDVARELQVTDAWVRERCADGTIPAFKFGRSWRIDSAELDRWREGCRFIAERPPTFEISVPRAEHGSVIDLLERRALA